jgi:Family of unknown function (DUF6527)
MKRNIPIKHEFVEFIPEVLSPGVVYVSIPYATAAHICFCGCGQKVVTPLSRQGWSVTFDGESVTLHPSVGNYALPCQSHYFIRDDQVVWARRLSREEIDADRLRDGLMPDRDRLSNGIDERQIGFGRRFWQWLSGS